MKYLFYIHCAAVHIERDASLSFTKCRIQVGLKLQWRLLHKVTTAGGS